MIVFVDLNGTLTHTADVKYKEFKDGLRDFNPTQIPLFHGSVDFISTLKNQGHRVIILSDSHPKYIRPIDERTFFRITIPCHEAAGNIIADIAHKDGSLKASKRGSLKTALQSAPETALQIINEIRNNPNVTLSEIAEKIGVSRRWIASNMRNLQDTGVVKRVGPNKGGYWEIIGK